MNREVRDLVHSTLGAWQAGTNRSMQSTSRVLGPSDLGGCREFIRATIAGDPKTPETSLKWAAFVGTAVGDLAETAMKERVGAVTQRRVTVVLPNSGIEVSGSTDAVVGNNRLIDFKTKDGLDDIVSEGPDFGQKVQVSAYFVGAVQEGMMTDEGTASLVYLDRSGKQPHPYVWSLNYEQAMAYLEAADERLEDVARALTAGESQGHLRDKPESWCFYVGCPFYSACWNGPDFVPEGKILDEEHIAAMRKYDRGRELAKAAQAMQNAAKETLGAFTEEPVVGQTEDYMLRWTLYEGKYGDINQRIDLRWKRGRKPITPYVLINENVEWRDG